FGTLLNLIHPEDRETQRLKVTEAIQKKQPYDTEYRILKTDGRQAVIHAQGEVVCDEAGRPVLIQGTAQDITERKLAEEALRKSEARYRSVVENAFDMIQSVAPDGHFLYVNPAWLRTMGYTKEELSNKTIFDIIHPSCREKCSNVFTRLFSGSSIELFETQFTAKDGRVIDIEGSAAVNMVEGRVKSVQGLLHDVTDRKRLEEELFRSQQDWEYTFNSITDMVTVHDKDFNIILANKAAEKILGLPLLGQMKDRKCFTYYHGTDHAPEGCPSCGCLGSAAPATFEVFEPHLNMFVEIRAIPRLDSSGNLIGLIHVVRDITERKKAEAERESLHLEKEHLQEQLLQSQKMEAVGTLSGGIAHDFNNILNVIIGYSGLLENMPGMTGRAGEFLSEITNAANRAANLTRGLLAFSRKQHLELKPADLNDIIRSISAMLHRVIGEDIRVNIELSEDSLIIICDSGQIEQIVVNLASNARDAMPKGGQLTLRTGIVELDKAFCAVRGFSNPGSYAVISLTDTGVGMNEEIVQRI
ncbi:MAG: PAS domain S-box protein, partial [Nitrospirota bacterium]|nr:PAS domain S-box protein [Nitrospirota bacterium]